ncbi:MAG: ABC transporter ATP-binding protein [Rhodospirillaceae bacterium]|nr:ABC transporter ATP-binding protein [Rhodospirillaceae bacterium]
MLRLVDISKSYVIGPITVEVLRGIGLDVRQGDLVSIMGPSGCGKTTLMNIIGLLDQPTSGSYLLEGREVSSMADNQLSAVRNARIGFVFQSFHLLPRLTALENVGLPLVYRGLRDKEIKRRAREVLDKVGMHDRADHRPNELSGGQQQRVAIARALVGAPALVLADEPTGALDPRIGQEIMQLFLSLNAEERLTVIVITHDPTIARQCRRRTRIYDGVLHEESVGC